MRDAFIIMVTELPPEVPVIIVPLEFISIHARSVIKSRFPKMSDLDLIKSGLANPTPNWEGVTSGLAKSKIPNFGIQTRTCQVQVRI